MRFERDRVGLSLSPGLCPRELNSLLADNIILILTLKGDQKSAHKLDGPGPVQVTSNIIQAKATNTLKIKTYESIVQQ